MTESLRDALAHSSGDDCPECGAPPLDEQVAAARKWIADWLRSDEAETAAAAQVDADYGSLYRPLGVARSALSALADALTKENPDD